MQENLIKIQPIKIENKREWINRFQKKVKVYTPNEDYVNEEYLDALKKREEEFPTGIKTQVAGLAIPHVDSKYIKKAGIAVVRLKKPILFQEMCTNNDVDVNLVFMLLVKDKSKQVTTLSALMGCFSNEEALKQLMTGSKTEIIEELEKILEENE